MATITISDDKLRVQSEINKRSIINVAIVLVVISILFWTFIAFFTWMFITVLANLGFIGWLFAGLFMYYNQLEIELGKKTLLLQSKWGK